MSTGQLTAVMIWVGALGALLTPIVYGFGSRWWGTFWGKANMLLHGVLGLAYLRSLFSVAKHPLPDSVSWDTWTTTTAMGVALTVYFVAVVVVTVRARIQRRRESNADR